MRQRGIISIDAIFAGAGVALVFAIIVGTQWYVNHVRKEGFAAGEVAADARWTKKYDAELAKERERRAAVEQELADTLEHWMLAEKNADTYENRWKEANREAHRNGVALGACVADRRPAEPAGAAATGPAPAPSDGGDTAAAPGGGGVRVSWEFVRRFDGGWTGLDGKPLSDLASGPGWAARAGALAPYGLDELAQVAGDNAIRCSRDRRKLATLIARIQSAAKAYGQ